jgi:glycosyltransferase involved in cell wall biosynthesis
MNVLHVSTFYAPTRAITGPPAALHRLCQELVRQGVRVRVVATNTNGRTKLDLPANRWTEFEGVPVYYGNRWGWNGDLSPAMRREIWRGTRKADLSHVTAIFSWQILSAAGACRRFGVPLVVSPRGSFAPEALAWRSWKKGPFMALGGGRALRTTSAFHATTTEEQADVQALFPGARVGCVPNGVDVPDEAHLEAWRRGAEGEQVLFLGRLHPHKNLDLLIRAWKQVAERRPQASLVIAGPEDLGGFEKDLRALVEGLGLDARVRFVGRKEGDEKSMLLARSRVLVLPSKSENFGNVVVEALAHGTPVIASRGTPWSETVARGCGWWVEAEEQALAGAIEDALRKGPDGLAAMGAAGRRWMIESYSWPAVAERMAQFYEQVIRSGRAPLVAAPASAGAGCEPLRPGA